MLGSEVRVASDRGAMDRAAGRLMLGTSRTSRNDSIIEFEQVRIETRPAGVYYVASPSRQATAEFKASSILDSSVVFENPEHDFPKKVMYRRAGADSRASRISRT